MGHEGHDDHDHPHHGHRHDHKPGHDPSHDAASPADEHRHQAPAQVSTYVITCSDTRTERTDQSGHILLDELEKAGHPLAGQALVKDEPEALRAELEKALGAGARAVIITGGTGLARRDITVEVVEALFEKRLDGFGELFRMRSYEEIGTAAMLSRATAGTWRGAVIFALPGSPHAVKLAMTELILPELGHLVRELMR